MSDDGTKILAVIDLNDFYVWEMDSTEVLFSANQASLQGTWSRVYSEGASLPGNQAKGVTCDATFFISEVSVVSHVNHTLLLASQWSSLRGVSHSASWLPKQGHKGCRPIYIGNDLHCPECACVNTCSAIHKAASLTVSGRSMFDWYYC